MSTQARSGRAGGRHDCRVRLRRAIDAFAPLRCRFCDLPSDTGTGVCAVCRGELRRNGSACRRCALPLPLPGDAGTVRRRLCGDCLHAPPPLSRVLAPFVYDPALAWLIAQWKYRRDEALADTLAALWLWATAAPPAVDCLLPIPLHWRRQLWRGFNQSADLSRALALRLSIPPPAVRGGPRLRRRRRTPAQAGARRRVRRRQLRGAFELRGGVTGLRVALVDDVCTTGATAEAAATVLLHAGAREVQLWCLGRTPRR